MEHALGNPLTSIALVTTAALICGLLLVRIRQPAVVGYIVAGVVLGSTGLGLVQNTESIQLLAELGVITLLFLIGMELNLQAFRPVYKKALAAAGLQILAACLGFCVAGWFLGWNVGKSLVFAFCTALSSTAVAIKILEETDDVGTPVGKTTVSVLIAQDLAVIPMLLIVSAFGVSEAETAPSVMSIVLRIVGAVGFLGALGWFLLHKGKVHLPFSAWITSRADIIPISAMAFCFSCATIAGMLGLSDAYGAFVAGIIIGNSSMRVVLHRAAEPIQAILLMVFFLSIGLLIDMNYLWQHRGLVFGVLLGVTLLKTIVNAVILHYLKKPWHRAFHCSTVMAQIGEFSFVLCAAGLSAKVLTRDDYRLMISVIALSLLISPMWLAIARRLHDMMIGKLISSAVPEDEGF